LIFATLVMVSLAGGYYAIKEGRQTAGDVSQRNAALKVMPLGDSITLGFDNRGGGGYRLRLWQRLVQQEKLNIHFVGSEQSGPAELGDKHHEGHGGWRIDQLRAIIDSTLAVHTPNVVLLHIGSNDLGQHYQLNSAAARLRDLADRICADRSGIDLIIAAVVPIVGEEPVVKEYNDRVPGIVADLQESGCRAHYVDMSQIVSVSELFDGVHPVSSAYAKMADAWYPRIKTIYDEGRATDGTVRVGKHSGHDANRRRSSPAGVRTVNDDVFNYKGSWSYAYDLANTYMGDEHDSGNTGDTFTFAFTGSGVILYGTKDPLNGIAAISIDDIAETLVDYYGRTEAQQVVVYHSVPRLSNTRHILKVRVTGESNPASSGTIVTVDRLDVTGAG
jgi:lysophospholipase L1-like esterase